MKVIIAGSRSLNPTIKLINFAHDVLLASVNFKSPATEIVCGMAKGADLSGKMWAQTYHVPVKEFPVTKEDWKNAPLLAGILRNEKMGNYADALIAIWDGKSTGTRHMVSYMQKLGKPYILIRMP